MWLSFAVSFYLSWMAISSSLKGEFKTEGYRVSVEVQGLFANPNDMSLHLTTMTPLVIALGIAARSKLSRLAYFALTVLFLAANMVTYSRGGFLGLLAAMGLLAWKIGRKNRVRVSIASIVAGALFILLAPGNYGVRILSIFLPGLDPVGSADMRKESLIQSVVVTLRNPWGIGIGNFPIVGHHNLQTHNAYTQVSSEIGLLGLLAYLIFMLSPMRKLGAIERQMFARDDFSWAYYMSIGIQASIVSFMVSSFFGAVAYNWFVYYLIAYAVCLRRIYQIGQAEKGIEVKEVGLRDYFKLQKA
jgi:MFS family permease